MLALLSKESGILLPLYALVIELTVFASSPLVGRQKTTLVAMLCAPLLALVAYIGINWHATVTDFDLRPFSMGERLLTQAHVLIDYLRQIVMPRLSGLGLFHDDFPISKSLLNPASTLISLVAIVLSLFLAIRWRKKWPLISLGILWFFAGHSLEAGPLALEIYFEHRNYLPSLGPLLALCSVLPALSDKLRGFLPLLVALYVAFLGFLTWQTAKPWGNEDWLMQIAVAEHPESLRAQQYAANKYIVHGHYQKALEVQEQLAAKYPRHTSTRLSILNLRCILKTLTADEVDSILRFVAESDYDSQIVGFLGPLSSNASSDTCEAFGKSDVHRLFDLVLQNPAMVKSRVLAGATHYHKGIAHRKGGDFENALLQLDLSYRAKADFDVRLQQVVWSLESGNLKAAEDYLLLARQHGNDGLLKQNFRVAELRILQQEVDRIRDLAATGP